MTLLRRKGLVSAIVTVIANDELAIACVESVLAQPYRPIEIIVVIGKGFDKQAVSRLISLSKQFAEIRVFYQPEQNVNQARETGRLNAKGEYVQYLNEGDIVLPHKFETQVQALLDSPHSQVSYGVDHLSDPDVLYKHKTMFPWFLLQRGWRTANPLYRRSIVDEVGPWLDIGAGAGWEYDCRIAARNVELAVGDDCYFESGNGRTSARSVFERQELRSRSLVRAKIFHHAQAYMALASRHVDIEAQHWQAFSQSVFEFGLQCAMLDMSVEARAMLQLSIEANGKKAFRHHAYIKLIKWLGWRRAAQLVERRISNGNSLNA